MIRLAAALLVILTHCTQDKDPIGLLTHGVLYGTYLGLSTFFFLSGLLVSQSLDQSPSRINFIWKRALRLYPGAWVAILLSALLLGPLVTTFPLKAYFTDPLFLQYLRTGSLVRIYYQLPGVFTQNIPFGRAVNGALWSLSLEIKLYLTLLLLSYIKKRPVYTSLLIVLTLTGIITDSFFPGPAQHTLRAAFGPDFSILPYSYALFFLVGSLCYQYRKRIVVRNSWFILIPVTYFIGVRFHFIHLAGYILLPATVTALAVHRPRWVNKITLRPDFSYGMYIYAYPIEQLVLNYIRPGTPAAVFFLTVTLTLPLAMTSWYLVESKALKWKKGMRAANAERLPKAA